MLTILTAFVEVELVDYIDRPKQVYASLDMIMSVNYKLVSLSLLVFQLI